MSSNIHTASALKLHAFGLMRLHDPNWTGMDLFDHLKQHVRGQREPVDLLRKTLPNGLLYHIGIWLFEELYDSDDIFHVADGEYLCWFLDDFCQMLVQGGVAENAPAIRRIRKLLTSLDENYEKSESEYYSAIEQDRHLLDWWYGILATKYEDVLRRLAPEYAADYADRVFHDRQLCEYLSRLLIIIGFTGNADDNEEPQQWIDRRPIPEWAKKAIHARDRGRCAHCGASIDLELEADGHIDHIIPLARGGTNDLVNLQLLCESCNLNKSANELPVSSSVPPYIRRRVGRNVG